MPPFLSREVTGALQLGGSASRPTLAAHLRDGETDLRLQGAADFPDQAYSATIELNKLAIASLLPAGDGTVSAQMTVQGRGFSESERRADLHLTVNAPDFNLAPQLSGAVQATLTGSAVKLDKFHFRQRSRATYGDRRVIAVSATSG